MNAKFISKEKNDVKFSIEFSAEEFEANIQKAYLAERGRIAIDGFRKGKAPRSIIEKKYGSSVFFETAVDEMLKAAYPNALDELKLNPIDSPDVQFGDEKLEQGKGFAVTITVTVEPEAEVKNYKNLEIEFEPSKVTAAAVNSQLEELQKKNARIIDTEEAAQLGNTVVLDYAGFVGDEQFAGGTAEGYSLKLGSGTFIPGFEEQLVGVKPGECKDVVVTFPKEYHSEALAGKEATFKCNVHEVKIEELPELDDEFAKDVSSFDTLKELKADIKKALEKQAAENDDYQGKNKAMLALCEANPMEIPQVMIDDEVNQMYNEYVQRLVNQGISAEAVKKYLKASEAQVKESYKADAEARVHTSLLIKAIAKAEGVEATAEDLEAEYKKYADLYKMSLEEVKKAMAGSESYMKEDIVYIKTVNLVYEATKKVAPKKEEKKEAAPKKAAAKKETAEKKEAAPKKSTKKATPKE